MTTPTPSEPSQQLALLIAMVIRNAMEDFHHRHLSDAQMRELNPIIRNAICTALHANENYQRQSAAQRYVDYQLRMLPTYWEVPQLLDGYVAMWNRDAEQKREP